MPTSPLMEIPKSQCPKEFESICKDVLSEFFGLTFKKFGRNGQAQAGIDIYAKQKDGKLIVAQCKNYLGTQSSKRLNTQISKDVVSASKREDISKFIVMTAQDRDVTVQDTVLDLAKNSSFDIDIWFWDELQEKICNNRQLLSKYYPSFYENVSIPIDVRNNLISNFRILEDISSNFITNYQNYCHGTHEQDDVTLYNLCVTMFNTTQTLVSIEHKYHLQLNDLKVAKSIGKLAKLLPDFHDAAKDYTGATMVYTNSNYLEYFISKKAHNFRNLCRKAIQKLEE